MRSKKVNEHQEHPLAAGSEDEVEVVSVDTHDPFAVEEEVEDNHINQ